MAGCAHLGLRFVTFDEEPNLQERSRRPFTCDDCGGPGTARFTMQHVFELFIMPIIKERAHAASRRR